MIPATRGQRGAGAAPEFEALLLASEARTRKQLQAALDTRDRARHADFDRLFAQVEALLSLRDAIALTRPLPATRGWAASPDFLLEIVRRIQGDEPEAIVELGSGVSSVVIAAVLQRNGRGHVVSLEHETAFAARTRDELAFHGLTEWATVVDALLVATPIGDVTWRWYDIAAAPIPGTIDLLVVDGPPGPTGPLARYPALPVLHDRLSDAAVILLDDGDRPDERAIIQRWQAEFPEFKAVALPLEKGAWVLRATQAPAEGPPPPAGSP